MRYKFIFCFLFFGIIYYTRAIGQNSIADVTNKVLVTSPQSAAFTQYTKVPVSLFTGIPDIKVPLYDIKVDNFDMPIYLSYYARGIQPNTHAGWVGTGWNLFAGAVITRKINGAPDELIARQSSSLSVSDQNPCTGCPTQIFTPFSAGAHLGWYWNYNICNTSNWTSLLPNSNCGTTGCPNYMGCITLSNTSAQDNTLVNDVGADEFDFNVFGVSGAFFKGEDGNWKVRSSNGENIKIKETVGKYLFAAFPRPPESILPLTNVAMTFRQFILTFGDGTQYIFGNNDSNSNTDDAHSIEFNRSGALEGYDVTTIAMAWHIVKIILPSGKTINFTYLPRVGVQYTYNPAVYASRTFTTQTPTNQISFLNPGMTYSSLSWATSVLQYDANINITDPVYLQKITFPEGALVFNSSPSNEKDIFSGEYQKPFYSSANGGGFSTPYPTASNTIANVINGGYELQILPNGNGTSLQAGSQTYPSTWRKLDSIELYDYNANKIKNVMLSYATQTANTSRLFLHSVQTTGYYGNSAGIVTPPYTFVYNSGLLPGYCSPQVDHWGFFNGTSISIINAYTAPNFISEYMAYRAPSLNGVQQYGILTQMNYPTGGFAKFSYEPNTYSKALNKFLPVTGNPYLIAVSPDAIGGGVRVNQIVSQPDPSSPAITYSYSYLNNNGVSSGVLGMNAPDTSYYSSSLSASFLSIVTNKLNFAFDSTKIIAFQFSGNNIFPNQNDDGNIVTYSMVTETQTINGANNGTKITTFTNHDNGYGNNPPEAYYFFNLSNQIYLAEYNDRSFERGRVLAETYKDNSGNSIKTVSNSYLQADNNSSYSKSILTGLTAMGGIMMSRMTAVKNYCFYPYLKQTVETDYSSDHSGNAVTTTTNYSYDAVNGTRNLVKKTVTNSQGQSLIDNMRYALDVGTPTASDVFSQGITNLRNMNAVGVPVEKYVQRANSDGTTNLRTISGLLNYFDTSLPFPNEVLMAKTTTPLTSFSPATVSASGASIDPNYEPRVYIDNFDGTGNVLSLHQANDKSEAYQWGYNNQYPVAKVKNASNTYKLNISQISQQQGGVLTFSGPNNNTTQTAYFTSTGTGTISLSMGYGQNPGTSVSGNISYQLVGPGVSQLGSLCNPLCATSPSTPGYINFSNMPAGNYLLIVTSYLNNSNANMNVTYGYPGTYTQTNPTGIKEFFYEGFEDSSTTNTNIINGAGHTGTKYWNGGSYTINFNPPANSNRSYIIQWWSKNGTTWNFNQHPYSSSYSSLGGQIDDIRIFPSDALMTTYTYAPLIGMTSETDPKGYTIYYEYDGFGRLKDAKDKDGNVLKTYQYHYQNQ